MSYILEHADLEIDPNRVSEFDEAIVRGVETIISKSKGFRGYSVQHSIERPARYILLIYWDSVEDHMIGFRESTAFANWRGLVGPFFTRPPVVEHMTLVGKSDKYTQQSCL